MTRLVHFGAIVLTAVILAPALSHLFSLSSKMAMDERAYFDAQAAYRGWSLFAVPLIATILLDAWLAFAARDARAHLVLFAIAGIAVALTLVVFFAWVQPGNKATANWTEIPADWRALRLRWEYGHAASALLTFASFLAVTAAAFLTPPSASGSP